MLSWENRFEESMSILTCATDTSHLGVAKSFTDAGNTYTLAK